MAKIISHQDCHSADLIIDGQFGVLVTTSAVGRQAYEEVREDRHPIIFLSGKDIAEILTSKGFNTRELVSALLQREFPVTGGQSWKQRAAAQ